MACSKQIQEEIFEYCEKNLTHQPKCVDEKMAELYRRYHKNAFRTIHKQLELGRGHEVVLQYRAREIENFTDFFNYVVEASK